MRGVREREMKEHLFTYPMGCAAVWTINWVLARFNLVDTLIPLRAYILVGFTFAWIPFIIGTPNRDWLPVTLLFLFGGPYGLYWVLFIYPTVVAYPESSEEHLEKISESPPLESTPSSSPKSDFTAGDWIKVILLVLVLGNGLVRCVMGKL